MAAGKGHNVGILIGIVVAEGNLTTGNITVVNLSDLDRGIIAERLGVRKLLGNIVPAVKRIDNGMSGESTVRIVATGVQNSDYSSLTGIAYIAAVENTCIVNVNGVLNRNRGKICIGNSNSLNAGKIADLLNILIRGSDVSAVNDVVVIILDLGYKSFRKKGRKHC